MKNYPFEQFKALLDQYPSISLYLAQNPTYDQVALALGLKLALEKKGKIVSVLSSSPMTVAFSNLVGVDTVGQKTESGNNLVISLNYPLDQIEKVSYNDEGGRLNLVVEPKPGAPRVDKDQAQFNYEGKGSSLEIIIGAHHLADLGEIGSKVEAQKAVGILISNVNPSFGELNIIDYQAASYSEIGVGLIQGLALAADEDIASNLYFGIKEATNGFTSETITAETFDSLAACLRWGVKKAYAFSRPAPSSQPPVTTGVIKEEEKPAEQPAPSSPSPDWLEPKIFKSSKV